MHQVNQNGHAGWKSSLLAGVFIFHNAFAQKVWDDTTGDIEQSWFIQGEYFGTFDDNPAKPFLEV